MMNRSHIAIIGAGVAGLCLALTLLRRGQRVTVYDPAVTEASASWAAAGMLAPTYEAATDSPGHPDLFKLLDGARDHWQLVQGILGLNPGRIGLVEAPSVALAVSPGQASVFRRLEKHGRARALGATDWAGMGEINPEGFRAAFWLPRDGQVDNRSLMECLWYEIRLLGAGIVCRSVEPAEVSASDLDADCLVDARGWRSPGMTPVKGTALALAPHPGLPGRVVRWGHNYLVPKEGRVVLGAHAMPGLADTSVDPAVVEELLEEAALVFPAVRRTSVLETWSGIRPRSADGAPVLGWVGEGHYRLGGLYRDGFLLAPLLADWAASDILGKPLPELAKRFSATRSSITV